MLVKVPSRFIRQEQNESVREIYINLNHVVNIEVTKSVNQKWDATNKTLLDEMETTYYININTTYGSGYIPINIIPEQIFQEFILWFNKSMALESLDKGRF